MTGASVNRELEDLLTELAESHAVTTPDWETVASRQPSERQTNSRPLLLAVVVAVALALVAGIVIASQRATTISTDPVSPQPKAGETPPLLAPAEAGAVSAASEPRAQQLPGEPRGAVEGPSGTVYSLSLARMTNEEIPGDSVTVGDFEARIIVDGSAPTQIYRTIDFACVRLTITTADTPALSPELEDLLSVTAENGAGVTIDLPPGWTSHGTDWPTREYVTTAQIQSDSGSTELFFVQSPGSPIGYYLFGETAPIRLASGEDGQLWHAAGATTPGLNTIIGTRLGTAFRLSGEVPIDRLRSIAEALVPVESPGALPPSVDAGPDTMLTEGETTSSPDCPSTLPTFSLTD